MTIPNSISMLRMLLVVPLIFLMLERQYGWALVLICLVGLSDLLDGWLARLFGWRSWLGAILDPAADKIVVIGTFVALIIMGEFPVWFFTLVLARDLVVVFMGAVLLLKKGRQATIKPVYTGKVAVALQITLVVLTLLRLYKNVSWNLDWLFAGCALATVVSLMHYLLMVIRNPLLARSTE